MATYKGIQGYTVQSLASDPTPTADYVGQRWYNSGSNVWKLAIEGSAAWASGNVMNTNRRRGVCAGTQGAGIAAGGYLSNNETETFNGTTWTSVNDLYTGKPSISKRIELGRIIENNKCDAAFITQLDSIAWLLNIRGNDIHYTPLSFAYAIISFHKKVDLFMFFLTNMHV